MEEPEKKEVALNFTLLEFITNKHSYSLPFPKE
jgi:hypothetical protein